MFISIFKFLVWFPLRISVFVGEKTLAAENVIAYRHSKLCNLEKKNEMSKGRR